MASCGQSVSNVVITVMLSFLINFYKAANRMEDGNLVVVLYFPYPIIQNSQQSEKWKSGGWFPFSISQAHHSPYGKTCQTTLVSTCSHNEVIHSELIT